MLDIPDQSRSAYAGAELKSSLEESNEGSIKKEQIYFYPNKIKKKVKKKKTYKKKKSNLTSRVHYQYQYQSNENNGLVEFDNKDK